MTEHITGKMDNPLRVLVFGAGAIGTYIGGSLQLMGNQVTFLERPKVADELRKRGLHLNLTGTKAQIPYPSMADSVEEVIRLGPYDIGLFALKSFDTVPALEVLRPHMDAIPPILCLQNGVDNEPTLESVLGHNKVIAGTVTSAVSRKLAGDITLERLRGIGIAAGNRLSPKLVDAFNQAKLNARLYSNESNMKWSKLLTNLIANATSAILDMTPAEIFSYADLYKLEISQLRETLAVMGKQGIHTTNLPATPVNVLAIGVHLPLWLSRPFMRRAIGVGRGGKMPSLHIDLHNGQGKSEVDYLNGAVVRHGEKLVIPTPVNRLLNQTVQELVSGKLPKDHFAHNPKKLIGLLNK